MSRNKRLKGTIHMHTTLSHDGTMSLEELADFLKTRGSDFIAVTDHSYDIDQAVIDAQVERAGQLSTSDFLILPGIEFRCHDSIDILGYGVTRTCDSDDPVTIIKHIKSHGGVAVWAHPTVKEYPIDREWIERLDGFEIWNSGNEGKLMPQIRTLKKYWRLKKWNLQLKAFCGLDLHRKSTYDAVFIEVEAGGRNEILAALARGDYVSRGRLLRLNSMAEINPFYLMFIYGVRYLLSAVRWFRDKSKI